MNKGLTILGAAVAGMLALTGCSGGTAAVSSDGEIKPHEISWLLSRPADGSVITVVKEIADEYAQTHPGFSLNLITTPDRPSYLQKLETLATANQLPELPFVAWPGPALPGWAGSLDLVVMLAPDGSDVAAASAVAEAVRRGSQVVVACPPDSMVAEHAAGRYTTILPTTTRDQLATAVVMLDYLDRAALGPATDPEEVASALDEVAINCSPHHDLAVNPAKSLAIALADANPVVWGGSVLAARAARRVAESIRRSSGRGALAGDAEHLLPVIEASRPRNVFDDPFSEGVGDLRPVLVVLDDGAEDSVVREQRGRLLAAAGTHGVRVETVSAESGSEVARYASLLLSGTYAAAYLQIGLVQD